MSGFGYDAAEAALKRALAFGTNPSLDGIIELCAGMGRPQDAFASIQVTGTNGKTSTVRLIEAILRAQGERTGLYTSPHLERYPERIEVAGAPVSDEEFGRFVGETLAVAETLRGPHAIGSSHGFTEFELLTAAALHAFRQCGVTTAVLEVGMGGRWDATTVVEPTVAVITGVGLDHTQILGDTLEAIAGEKAAIISAGGVAVLGPGTSVVERVFLDRVASVGVEAVLVREEGHESPGGRPCVHFRVRTSAANGVTRRTYFDVAGLLAHYRDLAIAAPAYQAANVVTAIAALEAHTRQALDPEALAEALSTVTFPGRFEVMREDPPLVVDGSHNPQAAAVLAGAIRGAWPTDARRPLIVLGVLADKDVHGIVEALLPAAGGFAVVGLDSPRALDVATLAEIVESISGEAPRSFACVQDAIRALWPEEKAGIVVTGSLVTAGRARSLLRRHPVADGK